jgi:hypothetical protein
MDAIRAIRVQREVFDELDPEHEDCRIIGFIWLYGGAIRVIIDEKSREKWRDPTKDEIIWFLWEKINDDPREVIKRLVFQELVAQDHANN